MYWQRGQTELFILLGMVVLFAVFVTGGLFPKKFTPPSTEATTNSQCCDRGDGEACVLRDDVPSIQFNGRTYKLIKSDIALSEQWGHLHSPQTLPDGRKIYVNDTSLPSAPRHLECRVQADDDLFFNGNACFALRNDTIIYVCKEGCDGNIGFGKFDAYFADDTQIPNEIKNCQRSNIFGGPAPGDPGGDLISCPTPIGTIQSLQLGYCNITKRPPSAIPWLSPYCKPAIYLYPEEKTDVRVQVAPQGKLTVTIPKYPQSGWNVTAYPDGRINHQQNSYDYLYYEAAIPDTLIEKPEEGFIVAYGELATFFSDILPKLGLNRKESQQFSDYWLTALPKSPYYFVGVVPTSNLDVIAPITINPSPTTIIRVTLYFEPLDKKFEVTPPTIIPVDRIGFTTVEWGGIVKTDPTHPFSCLM